MMQGKAVDGAPLGGAKDMDEKALRSLSECIVKRETHSPPQSQLLGGLSLLCRSHPPLSDADWFSQEYGIDYEETFGDGFREDKPSPDTLADLSLKANLPPPVGEMQGDTCRISASEKNLVAPMVTGLGVSGAVGDKVPHNPTSSTAPQSSQGGQATPAVTSTVMTHQLPKLVKVRGFLVLRDHVPIVEDIYEKYGNIASECKFSTPYVMTALMESLIRIVQLFQQNTARSLSAQDAALIHDSLHDLELAKFNVGWLKERYNEAILPNELAEDIKSHERLCRMISKTEAVLEKLKADLELVSTEMNKKRRILVETGWEDKVLGEDLL